MKKVLTFLLCATLIFSLAACTDSPETSDTGTPSGSEVSNETSVSDTDTDGTDTSKEEDAPILYDPNQDHLVLLGTDSPKGLMVLDLEKMGTIDDLNNLEEALVWQWTVDSPSSIRYPESAGSAGAKYRYSAYWKKDVVLCANSNGWVGVIDYETKDLLFEDKLPKGPHCIEMMPNGDLVVASSGNGDASIAGLYYFPLSQGKTKYSDFTLFLGAHGVCYDPENEYLWALGDEEVRAYSATGYGTENVKLTWIQGEGASLKEIGDIGGHNLTPVYGQPGKYWVTSIRGMYLFDTAEGTLSTSFMNRQDLSYENIKGIASFPDGTAVQTGYVGEGGNPEYASTALRIITMEMSTGKISKRIAVTREVPFATKGQQTYKVQAFVKDYQ